VAITCLSLAGVSIADEARGAIKQLTNIPAQNLAPALHTLAADRHLQVLYRTDAVGELHTRGAVGELSTDEALTQLLKGTGLTYRYLDEKTITIIPLSGLTSYLFLGDGNDDQSPANLTTGGSGASGSAEKGVAQLEEVVVTAQKREERIIDVPISIIAVGGDELQRRQINTFNDLMSEVPGLSVWDEGNQRRIILRGVSNEFGNSSAVGLYVDEADVTAQTSSQPELNTYDLERVEVLRGPQGTLYGEGSAGGTIRFITKDPVLSGFGLDANVSSLFTQGGAPSQRINSMINVPLIENELGLRVAGTFDHEGGWIDQPAAGHKDINSQNLVDVRIKGLWRPTEQFTATAMAEIHRNDRGINTGEDANGNFTQLVGLTTTPRMREDFNIYNLKLAGDVAKVRFLSTTTYVRQSEHETDYSYGLPLGGPPATTPTYQVYFPINNTLNSNFNQELRLSSNGAGPWQWTVGGFYRRFSYDSVIPPWLFGQPGQVASEPFYEVAFVSNSWSAFGDTSYKLTDRLTLTAGVRNFEDRQSYKPQYITTYQHGSFHSIDPRFVAQYQISDGANIYASAAKGFRSGGFNGLNQPPYGPESLWTYELGTKLSRLQGRLRLDLAGFYSDYTNYQIEGVAPPPAVVQDIFRNAGDAWIKGVEWTVGWRPLEQWELGFNGDYLDTRFYRVNVTDSSYVVGNVLPLVPKYQLNTSAQRDFTLQNHAGYVRLEYSLTARETVSSLNLGPWYTSESDVIHFLNLDAGLQWDDKLSLQIFARNLLNDRGYINPDRIELSASRAQPRTYGIGFSVKFE